VGACMRPSTLCRDEHEDAPRGGILVWLRRGCAMGEHERCFGGAGACVQCFVVWAATWQRAGGR
jgi:hypothetical protein